MQKLRAEKGITLIALVITIIVMLILVGVSVTVALNGGLFTTAKEAAEGTATKRNEELELSSGKVTINGEEYNSIDEYVNGGGSSEPTEPVKVTIIPKKETYTIGEPVTIGEEKFYIIADDTEKVTLLAKDCIDTTNLVQSASANRILFAETAYWEDDFTTSPYDIVEPEPTLDEETGKLTLPKSHTAAKAAYDYGAKLGGTGRLMTKSEAEGLVSEYTDIINGTNGKSSSTKLNYYLATTTTSRGISFVDLSSNGDCIYSGAEYTIEFYCVRPVVEILKTNIS